MDLDYLENIMKTSGIDLEKLDETTTQEEYKGVSSEISSVWSSDYDNELAKFAELIVRECDQYVAKHWDEMEPWMNPSDLLTHFGVEE